VSNKKPRPIPGTIDGKRSFLDCAARILATIKSYNDFKYCRSPIFEIGYEIERLDKLREKEKRERLRSEEDLPATLGSTLRQPYLVR
jgi:hypothetical protein